MKSAPSVIYGTNGMAGVIDVIPKSSADSPGFSGALELGENDRELYRARYGGGSSSLNYFVSANYESSDDFALSDSFDSQLNQPAGDRVNSDFERSSAFLHVNSDCSPLGESSIFYSYSDVERGMAPEAGVEDPDYERVTESRRQTIGLSNHFSGLPLTFKLYYNHYDGEIKTYTDASYTEVDEVDESEDYAWGGMLYATINTHENNTLILHGSAETDVYKAEGALEDSNRAELNTYNLAIEDQYWYAESFSIAVGGIYTWFEQEQSGDELTAFSPQIAFGYQLYESVKLHASAAQRTRFPKLRELYRRRYGNPDLKEQSANNYEVGVSYVHSASYVTDIALFRSDLKDLIERPDRRSLYQNLDDVTIEGVEFSSGGWINEQLFGRVSYTYVDAAESLPGGGERQLRSRPQHTTQVEARLRFPRNTLLSVNGIYVSDLYDLDEDNIHTKLPSYFVAHAKVAHEFREGVTIYLSVSNLTDKNYAQKFGHPREGRAFSAGLEFLM
jgi:outer membrane cobalamin receptor